MRGLADRALDILPLYFTRIHLQNITFISIGRLFRDYKKYQKDKKRFLHIHKFIGQDDSDYVLRESNKKFSKAFKNDQKHQGIVLLGKSMMGKTTMVFSEILHNKNILKHYWIFLPESAEALIDWHRRLPFRIDVHKIIIILDDLNKYATIDQQTFSKILDKFKNRKYILIATCRTGDEWKSVEDKFGDYFPNKIYLENISKQSAEKLSKKVEGADIGRFDGSPGSVVLGIGIQEKKIKDLKDTSPYCYSILQAAAICNRFLWFNSYDKEMIQAIIKDVLESKNDYSEYIKCTNKLEDNDLITLNKKGEISIIDAYLDTIYKTLEKHSENISTKIEIFVANSPEYKSRLADFYNYYIGIVLVERGMIDKSIEAFKKSIELKENEASAWYNLGTALHEIGKIDEAIDAFKKAINIEEDYLEAWINLGNALSDKHEFNEAIKAYQKAIELKNDDPLILSNLGNILRMNGDIDKSIEVLKQALILKENYPDALVNLGAALIEKGEIEEAINVYLKAIDLEPNHKNVWYNLGTILGKTGYYDKAIAAFEKALTLNENDLDVLVNLGIALSIMGEFAKAINAFRKAIQLKYNYPNAWYNLGTTLGQKGEFDEAIVALKKAIELEEKNLKAWVNLGNVYRMKGSIDDAINAYNKAINLKEDHPLAWYNLGVAFGEKGETNKEIKALKKAIDLKEDYIDAWYNLGVALEIAGNIEESKQAFEKSKELMKKK